jgi:hypothetical protein
VRDDGNDPWCWMMSSSQTIGMHHCLSLSLKPQPEVELSETISSPVPYLHCTPDNPIMGLLVRFLGTLPYIAPWTIHSCMVLNKARDVIRDYYSDCPWGGLLTAEGSPIIVAKCLYICTSY